MNGQILRYIRNSRTIRLFWGVMAVYLLNISVDTADIYHEGIPENLSVNDQESIVELLIEQILGFEQAFTEYDDHDSSESWEKKKSGTFVMKVCGDISSAITPNIHQNANIHGFGAEQLIKGHSQLHTPPPEIRLFSDLF